MQHLDTKEDEYDLFCRSLAPKLRKLPYEKYEDLQVDILNRIHKAGRPTPPPPPTPMANPTNSYNSNYPNSQWWSHEPTYTNM